MKIILFPLFVCQLHVSLFPITTWRSNKKKKPNQKQTEIVFLVFSQDSTPNSVASFL